MCFENYGLRKTWLENCLKRFASEDLSTSNMNKGFKHYLNLHSSNVNILIDQYELKLAGRSLL